MKKLELQQNTPEWVEARKEYRGASSAAIVMGKSPFTSIKDFKLISEGLKKQFYSKAMKQGHDLEDKVREWCNKKFKCTFKDECWVRGKYMSSLDGICDRLLVEIKVSDHTYKELKAGQMPQHYFLQVQQQLYCSPAESGYIVAYSPTEDDYAVSDVITEQLDTIVELHEAWRKFEAMPIPEGPVDRTGDGHIHQLFGEYQTLKFEIDKAKDMMETVKQQLIEESGNHSMTAGDFKLTRKEGAVRVDYKAAATDYGADFKKYEKRGAPSYMVTLPKNPFL